jgi:hypothetical protein
VTNVSYASIADITITASCDRTGAISAWTAVTCDRSAGTVDVTGAIFAKRSSNDESEILQSPESCSPAIFSPPFRQVGTISS